jgi:hypothetical protein
LFLYTTILYGLENATSSISETRWTQPLLTK